MARWVNARASTRLNVGLAGAVTISLLLAVIALPHVGRPERALGPDGGTKRVPDVGDVHDREVLVDSPTAGEQALSEAQPGRIGQASSHRPTGVQASTGGATGQGSSSTAGPATTTTTGRSELPATPVDSVAYQLNAAHSGGHEDPYLPDDLRTLWSKDMGGLISYVLIVGDAIYVPALTPDGDSLVALDRTTGATRWGPLDLGGGGVVGIAYDAGAVFSVDQDGVMQAFDARTGQRRWIVDLPFQYMFTSPPTAYGGLVYTGGAGSGGTVYAVEQADGRVVWRTGVSNGDWSSPAVSSDGVYVSYACEQTYGLNPTTGVQLWHHDTSCQGGGGRTPVLYDGRLYVRDNFGMGPAVLDAATGTLLAGFSSTRTPAFNRGRGIYVANGAVEGHDPKGGTRLWRYPTNDAVVEVAPLAINNSVFVADTGGTIRRLDAATGALQWTGSAGASVTSPEAEFNTWMSVVMAQGRGVLAVPAGTRLTVFG
jgi:outer membrane protein assembly factor BamB